MLFHLIGVPEFGAEYDKGVHRQIRMTPWQNTSIGLYRHMRMDVSFIPLKPTLFSNAKSAITPLVSMAMGIPLVASACLPYREFITDHTDGLLVNNPADFGRALREIRTDAELRARLVLSGHETARKHFIQDHWHDWYQALLSVLESLSGLSRRRNLGWVVVTRKFHYWLQCPSVRWMSVGSSRAIQVFGLTRWVTNPPA